MGERASEALRLEELGGQVGALVIDRPQAGNSFTSAMWERLAVLVGEAGARGLKALVLQSTHPRIFASGVDLDELILMLDDAALRRRHYRAMTAATGALAAASFVTIAAIAGACAGAGLSIALACDLRFAGPKARFVMPPARLGMVYPRADLARLRCIAGDAAARELLLLAEPRDAQWAARRGLVHAVVDDPDALAAHVMGAARQAAGLDARSIAAIKADLDVPGADEADPRAEEDRFVAAFDLPEVRARVLAARRR